MLFCALMAPWAAKAQESVPYTEGFETMSSEADLTAAGWISGGDDGCYVGITTSYHNTGSKALLISAWDGGSSSDCEVAALPVLSEPINTLQITLSYRQRSGGTVKVGYLTDANDAGTFVALVSLASSTSSFTTTTVDLSSAPVSAARIAIQQYTWYDCYIDDIIVSALPTCMKPTGLAAVLTPGNGTIATLNWTAGGTETNWVLEYSTASDFTSATTVNVTGGTPSKDLTGLTAETTYYARVKADCGGSDVSEWSNAISFKPTNAYTITVYDEEGTNNYIPMYGNYFDDYTKSECIIPATELETMQWGQITSITFYAKTVGTSNTTWANTNQKIFVKEVNSTTLGGSYSGMDDATIVFDGLLPMPTTSTEGYTITFSQPYTYSGGNLLIGVYNDDDGSYNNVTWYGKTGLTSGVSAYGNNGSSLASVGYNAQTFLPKTTFNYTPGVPPSCLPPANLTVDNITTGEGEISWEDHGESEWIVYYKKSTENDYTELEGVTDNPYPLGGLDPATTYNVYVKANCGGENSDPSAVITFTTECAAVTAFPWNENFDGYSLASALTPTSRTLPLCWSYINTCTNSNYKYYPTIFYYSYTNYANSTPNCLRLYSYYNSDPQPQYAILPEMSGLNGKQITLFAKGYNSSSTLKVGRMTDPTNASTFVLIQELTLTTSYQEFSVELTGTGNYIALMIDAANSTRNYNGVYVDDITVETIPTCKKPSALTCDSKTAHTATLSWTNGEVGQTAWQIAYSTESSFDPNGIVSPVNANANPFTVTGLTAGTTYYAYVRANCGNENGVSAWCNNKVTFTTPIGNAVPTGLAVAANTITSSQATANWTGVATNDNHASYDIYWALSTVNEVPAEPTTPNLIAGITETSQVIAGLDPETNYKVWVRDNCGTDGYSNWSSAVTFATASACQTPSGLAAGVLTNNSATLTWNAFGNDDFNLQYRVSGEEWDDNNIINNVNTPYTLNPPLTGNTTYQVRVQATCDDPENWSNVASFTTACDHESFPWSENFDAWASKSVCWSFMQGQYNMGHGTPTTYASAWQLSNSSTYGSIDLSGKALQMNLYNTNRYWAVTPTIDITTDDAVLKVDVAVAAWSSAAPNYDNNDTLAFAISTDGGATFTSLRELDGDDLNDLDNDYTTIYVPVAGYNGQAVRFAIYGGSISGTSPYDNRCVIDNVSVETAPSCYPVGTLTYANVGTHSAELSWTLVDNGQNAWKIEYATDENFTVVQTAAADDNDGFNFNGLTPETHYWVRVKADCGNGDFGEVSNVVNFTTEIACPAPTALTLDDATTGTLTVSWTGSAVTWTVAYKEAESLGDFTIATEDATNPYTITGLDDGTLYTVKVRANCGNVNGLSQWSATEDFQTEASCPSPTSLAVTADSETAHGATITWNGNAENDSYTIEYAEGPMVGIATLLNEGFEGGSMPTGWTKTGSYWNVGSGTGSGSYTGAATGNYNATCYISTGSSTADMLVTPAIDLSAKESATLSFNYRNVAWGSDINEFHVYYRVDGGEWHELYENLAAQASWTTTPISIVLQGLAANYQIGFKCTTGSGSWSYGYGMGIDDVVVTAEYTPSYSWNELATNATSPYTINTLDSETQYVVRVKGVCSSTPSPASNIVGFTTLIACPAPTALTVGTPTHEEVELSWTENGTAAAWVVAYKADGDADFTERNVTDNPYTLDGLDENTTYTVKVKANCGGEGPSTWTNEENFTTLEACPAPTALAAANLTQVSADLSWTGESDSYNIKYRTSATMGSPIFSEDFSAGIGDWTMVDCHASTIISSGSFRFHWSTTPPQYLISPEITGVDAEAILEFDYKDYSGSESFQVGYSTTTSDVAAFTFGAVINTPDDATWHHYSGSVPANTKYISIKCTSDDQYYFYVDNIVIAAEISAGAWQNTNSNTVSKQITSLTAGTKYDVQVQGVCGGTPGNWCNVSNFTTLAEGNVVFNNATSDGNWGTSDNWVPNSLPTSIDNVIIRANATIENGCVAYAYSIAFEGAPTPTLTIADGGQLYNSNSVAVTVQKDIAGYTEASGSDADGWYLIASPLTSTAASAVTVGTYDFYTHDEANYMWRNYKVVANQTAYSWLTPGYGYLYANAADQTLSLTGTLPADGPKVTDLAYGSNANAGWNLLGNHTAHNAKVTVSNGATSVKVMDASGIDYEDVLIASTDIAPCQGFFVKATAGGQTATVNADVRAAQQSFIALRLTDNVTPAFGDVAYITMDGGLGSENITLSEVSPQLYVPVDGTDWSVASVAEGTEYLPLNLKATADTEYTLTLGLIGEPCTTLILRDLKTGVDTDLMEAQSYTFASSESDSDARFVLIFTGDDDPTPDGMGEGSAPFAYQSGDDVIVSGMSGRLQIVDVLGRVMAETQISGDARVSTAGLAKGAYILRMATAEGTRTQKIVVR